MNNKYIPSTALVACSRLVDFAGAEIAALEIAEALSDLGVDVKLAALEVGPAIKNQIKLLGIEFIDLSTTSIHGAAFDLIWISHYVVAYHLLIKEALQVKTGIYSSLSHFEPLETPPLPCLSFSQYLVNSEENFSHFAMRYPYFKERTSIFPNAAPMNFMKAYRDSIDKEIKSIAVVSNHPPSEINELIELLRKENVQVDLIGIQGEKLRVTPEFLSRYSAIITIGKTVQYCLATGTPVFCYDHFGGPGWITLESFESAFQKNFSGRCTPVKRTAINISRELFTNFESVSTQRNELRNRAKNHFCLTENILNVVTEAKKTPFLVNFSETEKQILSREPALFLNQRQVILNCQQAISEHEILIDTFNKKISEYKVQIVDVNKIVAERDFQIDDINEIVAERDFQIDDINKIVAERDFQIDDINKIVAERDYQISQLNEEITQHLESLMLSRRELESVFKSTSWKLTVPLRRIMINNRLKLAYFRALLTRSEFVIRQEGIAGFASRTINYIERRQQRKMAARQIERFVCTTTTEILCRDDPLVSFIIPIYDRTDLLRTTINSALVQTLKIFEIILVTDGSPTATLTVVEEFRSNPYIRIFNYPTSSGNAVRGRNKGILEARGKYIAFLDSDDIAASDRLEVCLPILESGQADVVYGGWRALIDGSRKIDGLEHGQEVYSPDCDLTMLEKICVPCQSTVMVRRDMLLRTGFLKHRMQYREDHELWLRLAYNGAKFKSVPHVLTDLRLHAGNNELNFKGNDAHWEKLLQEEYRLPGPRPQKIAFLLAGLGISGGAAVVLKHISLLIEEGHDAFVIDLGGHGNIEWFGNPAIRVYRMEQMVHCGISNIDLLFATFWTTVEWLERIPARRKLYLVQSDERLFYEDDALKAQVAATYRHNCEYVTIAQWLVDMLRNEFEQIAAYVPNGLDSGLFYPDEPLVAKNPKRPRVLIEGPISVPFKGMVDAYTAVNELDCELWIVSSDGCPESDWRYDRFFEKMKQAEMRQIYSSCDILLKMSQIESFAYPPLEAMACGCAVVVMDVNGGIEYASDGENVLKVPKRDIGAAKTAVQKLMNDLKLRESLIQAGLSTVKCWDWESSRKALLQVVK